MKRILMVEDESSIYEFVKLELEYEGLLNEYLPNRQNYRVSLSSL